MMPSPSIHDRSDARHSCWLPAGSAPASVGPPDRFAVTPPIFWRNVRSACSPRRARPRFTEKPIASTASLQPPQPSRRGQIPIAPAAPSVPHTPRFRALALFGRRPPQRVDRSWHSGVRKPAQEPTFDEAHVLANPQARLSQPSLRRVERRRLRRARRRRGGRS